VILTGNEIAREIRRGRISISPYSENFINPNSYDFTLGATILTYRRKTLDSKRPNETVSRDIGEKGVLLSPNRIYLAHTAERFATDHFAPIFFAKSSVARLGLFIHVTANLIDIGHRGQWTLQLHAVQPIRIYPGMRIGQATFWRPQGNIRLYAGKYQDSAGPLASRMDP
jgi:dCTP deaminase